MNQKKRYFITIIFIIIFLQIYLMWRSGGNMNVFIQNHTLERLPLHLVVYIDKIEIFNDTLTYATGILSYNAYTSVGSHQFKIKDITNNKEYQWDVFLFPVTWYEINASSANKIELSRNFTPSTFQ